MNAILAVTWEPQLRGILITIIAVMVFCGSIYLILSTNLGARLGFLVAFAALAGWMFIMGAIWWSYGKGLLGPDASWAPISGRTVLDHRQRSTIRARSTRPVVDRSQRRRHGRCRGSRRAVRQGRLEEARVVGAVVSAGRRCRRHAARRGWALAAGEFQVVNVFDKGGQRSPQPFGTRFDFLAFFHKPHYSVVEVAPLVKQRDEPGRAPAKPEIDTSRPHQYVYMIRDLGAKRKPAGFITVGSLAVFLMLCYLLHTRDRRVLANRSARAIPAQTSSNRSSTDSAGTGDMMGQYLPVVCLLVLAAVFGALSFFASRLLAPRRPSSAKEAPYECGIVPSREPPERFPVTFYVVAMLFVMFDIELIFIYPFAVDRAFLGTYAFWEMLAFSVVFFFGLRLRRRPRRTRLGSGAAAAPPRRCGVGRAHAGHHHPPRRYRRSRRRNDSGMSLIRDIQRRRSRRPRAQRHHRSHRRPGQVVAEPQQLAGLVRAWPAAPSR